MTSFAPESLENLDLPLVLLLVLLVSLFLLLLLLFLYDFAEESWNLEVSDEGIALGFPCGMKR